MVVNKIIFNYDTQKAGRVLGMATANITRLTGASSRASAAEHIAVEASTLARMAKQNDFTLLAYLIDMAVLEAWREAGDAGSPIDDDPGPT
jgi:hypothetical protein